MKATALLPLATMAIAMNQRQSTDSDSDCILPSWSVHSASATYSDESLAPGKGSFTLTHLLTMNQRQSTDSDSDCILPSWSVHSASATYSDESLAPGKGSFTLTHLLTNVTERIDCALAFNTACRVTGTPADPELQWQFQVNIDFSWVVFNKSWVCEGQAVDPNRPTFAYGYAEFTMRCPEEVTPTMTCTGLDGGVPLLVSGGVWMPEVEGPEVEPE